MAARVGAAAAAASTAAAAAAAALKLDDFAAVDMSRFKLDHHLLHSALSGDNRLEKYAMHLHKGDRTSVLAHARLGSQACGHPGIAHGGALAALLDDAMGTAFFSAKLGSGFTASLTLQYKRPVPAGRDVLVHATIDRIEPSSSGASRKVFLTGAICDAADPAIVYTTAESLFIVKGGSGALTTLADALRALLPGEAAAAAATPAAAAASGSGKNAAREVKLQ